MAKRKTRSLEELINELSPTEQTFIHTGCIPVDMVTGGRGLPSGCMVQLYSESGYGKSTTCFSICKSLADQGKASLFASVEPNRKLYEDIGLREEKYRELVSLVELTTYSELEELFWAFLDSDKSVMIIDSITACCVDKVASGEQGLFDDLPASDARARSALLKVMQGNLKKHDKCIIYLNQVRANFNAGWLGEATTVEGGYTGKFYSAIQIAIKGDAGVSDITDSTSKEVIGKTGYLWYEKSRFSPPRTKIPIQILFGKGVSNLYSLLYYCYWKGYITPAGSSFKTSFNGKDESVRGRVARNEWVRTNMKELLADMELNMQAYYKALSTGYTATV